MNARERIASLLWWGMPSRDNDEARAQAGQMLDDHRAEVLREAADALHAKGMPTCKPDGDCCWYDAVSELRRMADEATS